jgi:hypothetical protein
MHSVVGNRNQARIRARSSEATISFRCERHVQARAGISRGSCSKIALTTLPNECRPWSAQWVCRRLDHLEHLEFQREETSAARHSGPVFQIDVVQGRRRRKRRLDPGLTGHRSPVTGHRSPVTGHRHRSCWIPPSALILHNTSASLCQSVLITQCCK